MAEEGFKRKLTAILSADVIGYSRLMRDDEEATVRDIASHRILITEIIQQHNGRVVDSPGDNILAEFASVVDAVNGAIKIQNEIKESNTGIHQDRRMEFRIGINLGDVIEEDERIYGDGVNIAARVEGLAAGGGIAISGTVYEHIKEKLSLGYHYLGEQNVKNISEPVRVYRLLTEPADAGKLIGEKKPRSKKLVWAASGAIALIVLVIGTLAIWDYYFRPSFEPASLDKMAFPLPEKPSIAVLPFDNIGGEAEQEYFSDGLTDNIITQLSQFNNLFVIDRSSSSTYKGKAIKVSQVAEELGVKYVLEGSVQRSDDRVRVTAQLIDATTGRHLWAERYERELKDIFTIQDEISSNIISELGVVLVEGEQSRLSAIATKNVDAWAYKTKGVAQFRLFTKEANLKARGFAEKAIELDPNFANAYSLLGWTYAMPVRWGISKTPKENLQKAEDLVNQAQALDASNWDAQNLLGFIYSLRGQYDRAIQEGQRAVELAPNVTDTYALLALSLHFVDRQEEAIVAMKKAMRLAPFYPRWFLGTLGASYFAAGQYEEAEKALKQYNQDMPDRPRTHAWLAVTYSLTGREDLARDHVEQALSINPAFSIEEWRKLFAQWKNREKVERILNIARKLGIPDKPPQREPDKPSIAVLPFDNISGDPEQEYFADGMTDDLITALSKISGIFVISRNSVFTFKNKPTKIQQVAKELNVHYILEGSVRRAGDKIRVNAQLIDANTDHHLWAEKYDGRIEDVFSLQDNITRRIVSALSVKLTNQEQALISSADTDNIEAYDLFLKARSLLNQFTPESFVEASILLKKATELDPNYSQAYALLADLYWTGASRAAPFKKALDIDRWSGRYIAISYLELAMKNPTSLAHRIAAYVAMRRRQFKIAAEQARKAIELSPNAPEGYDALSQIFKDTQPEQALSYAKMEAKLDPNRLPFSLYTQAKAYFFMKNYEKTVELMERACVHAPQLLQGNGYLVAALSHLGRKEEATGIYLNNFLNSYRNNYPPSPEYIIFSEGIQKPEMADLLINGLMKAGLPGLPDSYCHLTEAEKLSIEEVKEMVIDKTWMGNLWFWPANRFWDYFLKDGKNTFKHKLSEENREYGFDENGLYILKNVKGMKVKSYRTIYRNPLGNYARKNEYIFVDEADVASFSVLKDSE